MTLLLAICVAVIFAVSIYLLLSKELKAVAMGVFLFTHAAHLGILAMSGQPILPAGDEVVVKRAPVVDPDQSLVYVDPLPQALILTSIVISFAVMAFILTLLVATYRRTGSLNVDELAEEDRPERATDDDDAAGAIAGGGVAAGHHATNGRAPRGVIDGLSGGDGDHGAGDVRDRPDDTDGPNGGGR